MITIKFRIRPQQEPSARHGGFIALGEWPCVPSTGDTITFGEAAFGRAEVRSVTWAADGSPTLDLYLYRAIDKDIEALIEWGFVTYAEWQQGAPL